jgi:hypothetical protein
MKTRSRRARLAAAALNGSVALLDNARRLLFSSLTGLLAISSVSLGTYAGFSATTAGPGNTFSTGSVALVAELGAPSGSGAFTFGTLTDMVPGETTVKFLDVTRTGTLDFNLAAAASATASSALNTDATNGLQLTVKHCTVAWSGIDGCAGTVSTLYAGRLAPLTGSPVSLGSVTAATGSVAHLQLGVALPSTATSLNGLSSTIEFTWTATSQ